MWQMFDRCVSELCFWHAMIPLIGLGIPAVVGWVFDRITGEAE